MHPHIRKIRPWIASLFLVGEAICFVLVQVTSGDTNRYLSFFSILLCALTALCWMRPHKHYVLGQLALVFTVIADVFLVLLPQRQQLPAMLAFSVTQMCYFSILFWGEGRTSVRRIHLATRIVLSCLAIGMTCLVLRDRTDAVALVSVFYYAHLIGNIVFAGISLRRTGVLFFIGLCLFLCCDTLIGLACIDPYLSLQEGSFLYWLAHPPLNLAWMFYIPSQVALTLSLLAKTQKGNT